MGTNASSLWFDDIHVFGKLPPDKAARKLQEFGYMREARDVEHSLIHPDAHRSPRSISFADIVPFWRDEPWRHTAHTFGHIPLLEHGIQEPVEIVHAGNIPPDESLKYGRVTIRLQRLRVANYPGSGMHHILFDFYGENQPKGQEEKLHFNQIYRVREGESAGIIGYPIFIGLNVGPQGVAFRCYTVNVKNENDEAVIKFLDSDTFKAGLKLATTAQPAIGPLTDIAFGLTRMLAQRHKNVPVQEFSIGLDFDPVPGGARLAQGAYVAVQIPEEDEVAWDWQTWVYDPINGTIVKKDERQKLIPYNYIVFSVELVAKPHRHFLNVIMMQANWKKATNIPI